MKLSIDAKKEILKLRKQAFIYLQNQNYHLAFQTFLSAIKLGDAYSANSIANMYMQGMSNIIPKDPQCAFKYYALAISLPEPPASAYLNLGLIYENGKVKSKDFSKAYECYQKVCQDLNCSSKILAQAQIRIGALLLNGNISSNDVSKSNLEQALDYFAQAFQNGYENDKMLNYIIFTLVIAKKGNFSEAFKYARKFQDVDTRYLCINQIIKRFILFAAPDNHYYHITPKEIVSYLDPSLVLEPAIKVILKETSSSIATLNECIYILQDQARLIIKFKDKYPEILGANNLKGIMFLDGIFESDWIKLKTRQINYFGLSNKIDNAIKGLEDNTFEKSIVLQLKKVVESLWCIEVEEISQKSQIYSLSI